MLTNVHTYGTLVLRMKKDGRTTGTKERLFQAALDLFIEKGMEATSIRDIVDRVGISTAAFYNHFESKDALLSAVYESYRVKHRIPASVAERQYLLLAETTDPVRFFQESIDRFLRVMKDPVMDKLGRIVSMEKGRNRTAAEISFADRGRLLRAMEAVGAAYGKKGCWKGRDGRQVGRMLGYIQLGLFEDNHYRRLFGKEGPEEIAKRTAAVLIPIVKELMEDGR
jgi:AcrR family transcriptional regulator